MNKFKVTYNDYGTIRAVVFKSEWFNVYNDAMNHGVLEGNLLKIEVVIEANEEHIDDYTND